VSAEEWDANCLACAGDDACASCACQSCAEQLHDCEATPGCQAIAECVRASACVGIQCYCGSDTAAACAAEGGGNGPCKEVILSAPGGKPPNLAQPSAGPASDALAGLATCLQGQSTCGSVCN
jgi:hypothetical protein